MPSNSKAFCAVYGHAGKADLSEDYCYKIGDNHAYFRDN